MRDVALEIRADAVTLVRLARSVADPSVAAKLEQLAINMLKRANRLEKEGSRIGE
jgi:hypothetical protein